MDTLCVVTDATIKQSQCRDFFCAICALAKSKQQPLAKHKKPDLSDDDKLRLALLKSKDSESPLSAYKELVLLPFVAVFADIKTFSGR